MSRFIDDEAGCSESDSYDSYSEADPFNIQVEQDLYDEYGDPWYQRHCEEFKEFRESQEAIVPLPVEDDQIRPIQELQEVQINDLYGRENPTHGARFFYTDWIVTRHPVSDPSTMVHHYYQMEKTPTTGKLHWQGTVKFKSECTYAQAATMLGIKEGGAFRIFLARGSEKESVKYCNKEETRADGPYGFGEISQSDKRGRGKRTDLIDCYEDLVNKRLKTWEQVNVKYTNIAARCGKWVDRTLLGFEPERTWKTDVYIHVGTPGTGKTQLVYDEAKKAGVKVYAHMGDKWWDGYIDQEWIVFDDFYGSIPMTTMLKVCDAYATRVETKGGTKSLLATKIFITSNKTPQEWWPTSDLTAFYRRVKRYFIFSVEDGTRQIEDATKPEWKISDRVEFPETEYNF